MLPLNENLKKRLATIIVGAPIVIGVLYLGGVVFEFVLGVAMLLAFYEWLSMAKRSKYFVVLSLLGALYILTGFVSLYALREIGFFAIFIVLLCVWMSDSVAYIAGKTFGGARMSPTISPNKTWAGYAGALIGPMLVLMAGINNSLGFLVFGAVIGVVGQSGDLIVSALKRHVGAKDTGALFPGHGGILDRIDALLLVAPVFLVGLSLI